MQFSAQPKKYSGKLDTVGSVLSLICAVHCFLVPIVVVMLPVALAQVLDAEGTHSWHTLLVSSSLALAVISVIVGHKQHKNYNLFFLPIAAAFLFLLASGHHDDWGQAAYMGTAGVILVATHLINRKLCQSCTSCESEHAH